MKTLKKFTSVLLALVMALGLTCTAFASSSGVEPEQTTYTITIDNDEDGYQYTAYQIFTGDLSTLNGETVLTNVSWGKNVSGGSNLENALMAISVTINGETVYPFANIASVSNRFEEILNVLASYADDYDNVVAQAFAEVMYDYIGAAIATSTDSPTYTISGLDAGYYLIETTKVPENGAYSRYILALTEDESLATVTEASDKSAVPTIDKAVSDLDAYIGGDPVTYYLAATLPTEYASYSTYQLNFCDTLSAGLTYTDSSVVVKVFDSESDYEKYLAYRYVQGVNSTVTGDSMITGTTVASGYTATIGTYDATDGTAITISIADTNALYEADSTTPITVTKDSIIAIEFQATLNSSAVIGGDGNPNEVYLTYSNDPNWDRTGTEPTGKTVTDIVYTWTYQLTITKTNESGEPLEGAEFKLYREFAQNDNEYAVIDTDTGIVTSWVTDIEDATLLTTDSDGKLIVGSGDSYGYIVGVDIEEKYDDSNMTTYQKYTYYLKEITAPTGYNALDAGDSRIEITTTYTQPTDTDLTVDYTALSTLTAESWVEGDYNNNITAVKETGTVSVTIVNKAGFDMPSTGGIGTTIFYVVGGVLVVGAVVLLITRKRMGD